MNICYDHYATLAPLLNTRDSKWSNREKDEDSQSKLTQKYN